MRGSRSRWRLLPLVWLALTLTAFFYCFIKRDAGTGSESEAFAAPPAAKKVAVGDAGAHEAGAGAAGPAASGSAAPAAPDKKDDDKKKDKDNVLGSSSEPDPIDVSVAHDGGVPSPPPGAQYKSPFAKANSTPVNVK